MTSTAVALPVAGTRFMRDLHSLLTIQSIVVVLLSINRLSGLTSGYVAPNQFLRWVDLNNMLILPLISLIAFYLLKHRLEAASRGFERAHLLLGLLFVVGVYALAAGYGAHEVTNYLHVRFCLNDASSDICRIIIFNDDTFSHWVFFAGFTAMNTAIMLLQALVPQQQPIHLRDTILLSLNALFIGAGIFANLAFEVIGLDLYIVAAVALLAVGLLWRRGLQPLTLYYAIAYLLGLLGTALYKGLAG